MEQLCDQRVKGEFIGDHDKGQRLPGEVFRGRLKFEPEVVDVDFSAEGRFLPVYGDGGIYCVENFENDDKPIQEAKRIQYLQVPCYLNWIAPVLSSCLRSEGVIPSLLASPIVEA